MENFLLQKCISFRLFNQGMANFRVCEKIRVCKMCMSQIAKGPQSLMVSRVTGTECREEEKIYIVFNELTSIKRFNERDNWY